VDPGAGTTMASAVSAVWLAAAAMASAGSITSGWADGGTAVMGLAVSAMSAVWLAAAAGGGVLAALGVPASACSTATAGADGAVTGMRLVAAAEAGGQMIPGRNGRMSTWTIWPWTTRHLVWKSVTWKANVSASRASFCSVAMQFQQCGWQQLPAAECEKHSATLQALAPQLQCGRTEESHG